MERLGEEVPEEAAAPAEEAEGSPESVPTTTSQSAELGESVVSGRSTPLPGSIASAEELAKLRPRIDPQLCPPPG